MNAIPLTSNVECKGLGNCEVSPLTRMSPAGQGSFRSFPPCTVELKIFIPGLTTKIVQVGVAKYKAPVRIEIRSSGHTIPDLLPPAVSSAK
jgi:hypothetical protein